MHIYALNTVLTVVRERPSTFLAPFIRTVSSWFTNIAFSSDTTAAYSRFGTITFILMYLLIQVQRESVRIESIVGMCTLPVHIACAMLGIPRPFLGELYAKVGVMVFGRS